MKRGMAKQIAADGLGRVISSCQEDGDARPLRKLKWQRSDRSLHKVND